MSAEFTVKSYDLTKALDALIPLFPAGQKSMPLGMSVKNGALTITCLSGCVYQAEIPVDSFMVNYDATILYHDITPLLHSTGNTTLEFSQSGLTLKSTDISCDFVYGYSVVPKQEFSKVIFKEISSSVFTAGLKDLINMNLDKLYGIAQPIIFLGDLALQKFPNTWVQVRTPGLGIRATMDLEHVKLLLRFSPTGVCSLDNNTLLFKNAKAILQLPCKPLTDDTLITELMSDLGEPVNLDLSAYTDKVRLASKINSKASCRIAVFSTAIKTTIKHERTSISIASGYCNGEVSKVFDLPIQVWLIYLKAIGSGPAQIVTGGDKVCLRTPSIIILTRALH